MTTICQVDNEYSEKRDENQRARATRFGYLMKRIEGRVYELENERLDRRFIRAGANQTDVSAVSKNQSDGVENDRLAGAGLAGDGVEARVQLQLKFVDDREISDF